MSGEGDHWVVQGTSRYPDGTDYHIVAILELRDGKIFRETDYFGPSFPAPEWRRQWVERVRSQRATPSHATEGRAGRHLGGRLAA